ncbi:hypothetical protein HUU51_05620, partial [Candidatus Gracilibacteria bacterium]|nr:hypothetical protein [Candidatus Gracilibacteria bacterium]
MKKILIITPKFFPSIGGIEEQVKLLGENFIKKGYKVDILTNKFEEKIKNKETILGLKIFRFQNIFYYILFLIKNRNYELIISRQYYKNSFILGLLKITRLVKSKTIICTDSGGKNDEISNIKNKLEILNLYKLYFYIIGKNDYLNCLNSYNIKHLNKIFKENIKVKNKIINIYNGIDINNLKINKINKIRNILFI